jgi:hypothetical protein
MRAAMPWMLAAVSFACACPARAGEESAGTRVAGFLSAGTGPAVLARGGATFALGGDLQSAASNPAALAGIGAGRFSFSHAALEAGATQEWAAWGGRLRGGQTRIGLAGVIRDEGTVAGRDAFDQPTSDAQARSWALSLQLARPLSPWLVVGGAAHWIGERIGDSGGDGLAFDAGAQVHAGALSLALAGQNFGGGMNWGGRRWRMPASLGAGIAIEHAASGLRFVLDLVAPADYYRSARAGAEWRWRDRLALRGGYRRELGAPSDERLDGPAFGFGAGAGSVWFDYAYVLSANGEATHRIGLDLRRIGSVAAPVAPESSAPPGTRRAK